jgi:hypothetical protein
MSITFRIRSGVAIEDPPNFNIFIAMDKIYERNFKKTSEGKHFPGFIHRPRIFLRFADKIANLIEAARKVSRHETGLFSHGPAPAGRSK